MSPEHYITCMICMSPVSFSVVCGPVSSSVFVDNCRNCTFIVACQQVYTVHMYESIQCSQTLFAVEKSMGTRLDHL